ncbi:MAG TPA: T9SS type A sorting domain-containing protein [Bacteroidia bacterium]|nr:T9SS type A sorting domain-containing protein [Bacteroidia bacterium]
MSGILYHSWNIFDRDKIELFFYEKKLAMRLFKKIYCILFLILGMHFQTYSQWVQRNSLPGNLAVRDGAVSWVIGSKCYIVGGNGHNDLLEFDPGTQSWTAKALIPQGVTMFGMGFVCNGKGYLCGGNNQNFAYYSSLWEYDPQQDLWTQKRDFPTGKRADGFAFSIGDKGYVGCGDDSSFVYSDFYKYDPITDNWTPMPTFLGGYRMWPYAFAVDGKGYVGGGSQLSEMNDLWQFDTLANMWIQKSSLPGNARQCAVSFSSADYGIVGLGQAGFTNVFDDVYKYDPANDLWDPLPDFNPGGRAWATGFAYGDNIYMGTGWNFSTFYRDIYMLDISTGISTPNNNLNNVLAYQSHGSIVVEFNNQNDEFTSVELIDAQGKRVKNEDLVNCDQGMQKIYIPCNGIPTGIYFVRVVAANESVSLKMMVNEF